MANYALAQSEKLLPFSEILNWSQFAIFVPESEALEVVPRLRAISAEQRCEMRHRAHQAFHTYFANVSSNVRGLMEVLKLHWLQGFGPNEDSRKLTEENNCRRFYPGRLWRKRTFTSAAPLWSVWDMEPFWTRTTMAASLGASLG
eukprot:g10944.t1